MDDLIRARIHEALDVEPPPRDLRHFAIWAVPMPEQAKPRRPKFTFQWAGAVAALLAIAIVVGLIFTHGLLKPQINSKPRPGSVRFASPEGIAIGPDGTVYVSDWATGILFRIDSAGRLVPVAGGGSGTGRKAIDVHLQRLVGVAVDRNGYIYVAEAYRGNNTLPGDIRRIDPSGAITTLGEGALENPQGLALDSVGTLYFSQFNGSLGSFSLGGYSHVVTLSWLETPPLPGPLVNPGYMAFDSRGNLFFSDKAPTSPGAPGGCRIVRMTPDKVFSVVAGTGVCGFSGDGGPAAAAQLDDPNGIAFDSEGNLYFSDAKNHRIRRIDTAGVITTVAGTGQIGTSGDGGPAREARLSYPFGMGIASGDRMYFSDASCSCDQPTTPGRVRVIDLRSGVISTIVSGTTPIANATAPGAG